MKRFLQSDDADMEKQRELALLERLKEPETGFDATPDCKEYVEDKRGGVSDFAVRYPNEFLGIHGSERMKRTDHTWKTLAPRYGAEGRCSFGVPA